MLVELDELIRQSLQAEADEVCTPDIRDKVWAGISARINSGKASGNYPADMEPCKNKPV